MTYQIVLPGKRLIDGDAINLLANLEGYATTYSITAGAGGLYAGAVQLNYGLNEISTVTTTGDGVILPSAQAGSLVYIINDGAHTLKVFGQGTDTINGTAGATGISVAAAAGGWFVCIKDGAWVNESVASGGAGSFSTLTVSSTSSFGGAISTPQGSASAAGTTFGVTAGAGGATTGAGGPVTLTGGAGTASNSAGGAGSLTGGAGQGSAAGGLSKIVGGAGGATGAGGAAQVTGGAGGATSGTGGAAVVTGGAGTNGGATGGGASLTAGAGNGTGAGGATSVVGGGSGAGATGNGGATSITGGAALSTAGNGGSVIITGGVKTTTGTAGMIIKRSVELVAQGAPAAKTTSATLTAAEVLTGIITVNQGAAGTSAQQLPLGSALATAMPDAASGDAFDFSVINISVVDAEDASITTNTDWTLVGNMDIPAYSAAGSLNSSGRFRARKTGATTWTLYRLS